MRVVHYLNQFFGGIGGEDRADAAPETREGAVGPGHRLQAALGEAGHVVGTVICGDGRFADRTEDTASEVLQRIDALAPDLVIAGPAFASGRYGLACGRVCADVQRLLGRPAVTGMHPDNVGRDARLQGVVVVATTPTAAGMEAAMTAMARLGRKLVSGEPLTPARIDGYLPRGRRQNWHSDRSASARALRALLARLRGEPFQTEVELPRYEIVVPPAPIPDVGRARIAIVTECGLVPAGNPDRLEVVFATKWLKYSLQDKARLDAGEWDVAHGGYNAAHALEDPNRLVPLDAMHALRQRGELGTVHDTYYVTCGAHAVLSHVARYAREIAEDLRAQDVDGVLLVAT